MPNLLKRSILAFAMPGDMIRVTHLGNPKEATSKAPYDPAGRKISGLKLADPSSIMQFVMKITTRSNESLIKTLFFTALSATVLSLCSCAPDPELQRQMDQDILSASELRKAGDSVGPQQGRGSQAYGHGGF